MVLIFSKIFPKEFIGLTLWPIIFLKEKHMKGDWVLLNHERIHLRQQWELWVLPFYVFYGVEWFLRFVYYRFDGYKAYRMISFEQEAYAMENHLDYLQYRKTFSFLKYLCRW
ncbi:MAG: hypothetical protein OIF50_08550 [Flavobacteriaceae bacterium]|nr:hypothetical protein [Flavobacteriaceae bacterium]